MIASPYALISIQLKGYFPLSNLSGWSCMLVEAGSFESQGTLTKKENTLECELGQLGVVAASHSSFPFLSRLRISVTYLLFLSHSFVPLYQELLWLLELLLPYPVKGLTQFRRLVLARAPRLKYHC
jgi:hypothetical protein